MTDFTDEDVRILSKIQVGLHAQPTQHQLQSPAWQADIMSLRQLHARHPTNTRVKALLDRLVPASSQHEEQNGAHHQQQQQQQQRYGDRNGLNRSGDSARQQGQVSRSSRPTGSTALALMTERLPPTLSEEAENANNFIARDVDFFLTHAPIESWEFWQLMVRTMGHLFKSFEQSKVLYDQLLYKRWMQGRLANLPPPENGEKHAASLRCIQKIQTWMDEYHTKFDKAVKDVTALPLKSLPAPAITPVKQGKKASKNLAGKELPSEDEGKKASKNLAGKGSAPGEDEVKAYATQRDELAKLLSQVIETVDEVFLLERFMPNSVSPYVGDTLRDVRVSASKLKARIEKTRFTVVVMGLEKAGKSTFINALLGTELLPSALSRCTYVATRLLPGDRLRVEVKATKIPDSVLRSLDGEVRDKFSRTTEMQPAMSKDGEEKDKDGSPNSGMFLLNCEHGGMDQMKRHLQQLVANETLAPYLQEVKVYAPDCLPVVGGLPVELLDLPGVNAGGKQAAAIVKQNKKEVADSDQFIIIKSGIVPNLTDKEQELMEWLPNGYALSQKGFGAISRLDMMTTPQEATQAYLRAEIELKARGLSSSRIYKICSPYELARHNERKSQQDETNFQRLQKRVLQVPELAEGFPALQAALQYSLQHELARLRAIEASELADHAAKLISDPLKVCRSRLPIKSLDDAPSQAEEESKVVWRENFPKLMKMAQQRAFEFKFDRFIGGRKEWQDNCTKKIAELFEDIRHDSDHTVQAFHKHVVSLARQKTFMGRVNVEQMELDMREQLLNFHLDAQKKYVVNPLADLFYGELREFWKGLTTDLGDPTFCDSYLPMNTWLTKADLTNQVEALVFRKAYPLANAVLPWRFISAGRGAAMLELHSSCPDVLYSIPLAKATVNMSFEQILLCTARCGLTPPIEVIRQILKIPKKLDVAKPEPQEKMEELMARDRNITRQEEDEDGEVESEEEEEEEQNDSVYQEAKSKEQGKDDRLQEELQTPTGAAGKAKRKGTKKSFSNKDKQGNSNTAAQTAA
eukprot:g28072.t1